MKTYKGAVVGYNVQIAVDSKHNLIAEQQVHTNVNDVGLLAQTAVAARENLAVEKIDVVADRGYYKIGDVEACEAAGVTAHVPNPVRSPTMRKGHFGKSLFRYDETTDTYACPGGHRLRPAYFHDLPGGKRIQYANRDACRGCPLRSRCTTDTHRRISRYANGVVMDRMAERLAAQPVLLDRRRELAEHPFGTIKQWMGQGTFLTRPEQRPRRVQPDGARLQHAASDESCRRPDSDHRSNRLTPGRGIPAFCPEQQLGSLAKTHRGRS